MKESGARARIEAAGGALGSVSGRAASRRRGPILLAALLVAVPLPALAGTVAGQALQPFDLPPGATVTVTFEVTVNNPVSAGTTEVCNQGTVNPGSISTDDPDDATGSADPTCTPILATPVLAATKSVSDASANGAFSAGEVLTYTITVDNSGNEGASNLTIDDAAPAGTTYNDGSGAIDSSSGASGVSITNNTGALQVTVGELSGGGSITVSFTVTVDSPAPTSTIDNTADVTADGISTFQSTTASIPPEEIDFGDAPDPTYPTLGASDGARHLIDGLFLGACVDSELDGQPSAAADGDDLGAGSTVSGVCAGGDDEDGVTFPSAIVAGETPSVTVVASGAGLLDAWMDFDQDGDWADAGEQIFSSEPLAAGANALSFAAPAGAVVGDTYARFRVSTAGGLAPTGFASDGEVEDHAVTVEAEADLSVTIDDLFDPVVAHDQQIWEIEVTNNGPSDATDVEVEHQLPTLSDYLGVEPSTSSCAVDAANRVTCDLGDLASGASATIHIGAFLDGRVSGAFTSDVTVGAAETDPDGGNDSASAESHRVFARSLVSAEILGVTAPGGGPGGLVAVPPRNLITGVFAPPPVPPLVAPFAVASAKEGDTTVGLIGSDPTDGSVDWTTVAGSGFRTVALARVDHFDDTPSPEVAALGFGFDGSVKVFVFDAGTRTALADFPVPGDLQPIDIAGLPDVGGPPTPDVAVLGRSPVDGSVHTVVLDADTGLTVFDSTLTIGELPLALDPVPDFTGGPEPELAVLTRDPTSGATVVRVLDGGTGFAVTTTATFELFPFDLAGLDDVGLGPPDPDVAIAAYKLPEKKPLALVLDAGSGLPVNAIDFDPALEPREMVVVPDFAGTPAPELAILGRKGLDLVVEIKDARDDSLVGLGMTGSAPKVPVPLGLSLHPDFGGGPGTSDLTVLFEFEGEPASILVFDETGLLFDFYPIP